jgi:hypothetical protein
MKKFLFSALIAIASYPVMGQAVSINSSGASSTLAWSTSSATTVTLSGGTFSSTAVSVNASMNTGALYSTTTYTLYAYGTLSSVSRNIIINVIGCTTGVQVTSEPEVKIFPNPFFQELNVRYSGSFTLQLITSEGKLVYEKQATESATLYRDGLSSGTYLLRILRDGNDVKTFKVVAQ